MYKVKIPLFLRGMEGLVAGLNARKGEGCVVKGRGECVEWRGRVERTRLCGERLSKCAGMNR